MKPAGKLAHDPVIENQHPPSPFRVFLWNGFLDPQPEPGYTEQRQIEGAINIERIYRAN
jgi:hypothetical protein